MNGVEALEFGKAVPGKFELGGSAGALLEGGGGEVFAAYGTVGATRCVAFAHGAFLIGGVLHENESGKNLVLNSVRWSGKGMRARVGVAPGLEALQEVLRMNGLEVEEVEPGVLGDAGVDVYCVIGHKITSGDEVAAVRAFMKSGGGLVVAATPWAFGKKFSDFSREFPGNRLLSGIGISFSSSGTVRTGGRLVVSAPRDGDIPDPQRVPIAESKAGPVAAARRLAKEGKTLPADEKRRLVSQMLEGVSLEGKDLLAFRDAVLALDETVGPVVPTKEEPVPGKGESLKTAIVRVQTVLAMSLPAAEVRKISAADDYPGSVPDDAERLTETVTIDATSRPGTKKPSWSRPGSVVSSTGLYAPPGEVVRVSVPANLAGEGFKVRIGLYRANLLEKKDAWWRYPQLSRDFEIEKRVTEAANAFGGMIYLVTPRGASFGEVEVEVEGAVRAPSFFLGKTDPSDWKDTIRKYPAPRAELGCDGIIFELPSDYVRGVSDPVELMEFWNSVAREAAELLVIDRDDLRPERAAVERQIVAGAMHSGYPVGTHISSFAQKVVDLAELKEKGGWGIFHELGHNHQQRVWYLPGTTEATCNLWSVRLSEEVLGISRDDAHRGTDPFNRRQAIVKYVGGGKNFEADWNTFTALEMYLQYQEAFGWEALQRVFEAYNDLPKEEEPADQQDRNDELLRQMSVSAGRNLGPFFLAWNVPVSESALASVADRPDWEEDPMKKHR